MKLVTVETMRAVDHEAIVNRGIPGPELMENAGRGIAERIRDDILGDPDSVRIAVFCGKGNNGGDGFVVGRYLHQYGCEVTMFFPSPVEKLSDDARLNHGRAAEKGVTLRPVESIEQLPGNLDFDYIIDAVFGTGFSGAPRGLLGELIESMNRPGIPIIAVDCPSGLDVDTGRAEGAVVRADHTFTLGLPKFGQYYSPGRELCGPVKVVPIGIPDDVIDGFAIRDNLITADMVASFLPERRPDGHKGDFGRLFILAGSTGLTGAATLAATASVRSGLGLVTVGCPRTLNPVLETKLTEAMTWPLPDVAGKGVLALRGLGEINRKSGECDAVVIGPGIGRHHETRELIARLIGKLDKPAIIDADGLNAFENNHAALAGDHPAGLVLTPHPSEFARLIDEPKLPRDIFGQYDLVRRYARTYDAVIVYKGSPTVVVAPDGALYLNPTGNDGMASGGTGDVLSGIIGSFLAQGMAPLEGAVAAVHLHGLAGDLAAAEYGRRALMAGDLIEFLPDAFEFIEALD